MKSVILGEEAVLAVQQVVQDFETAVGSTLGPNGNYSVLSAGMNSKVTKDGATVAKAIDYDNPTKAHIANVIREAAIKTETECGDGTTTTTLFACDFFKLLSQFNSYREHKVVEELTERTIALISNCEIRSEAAVRAAALISANKDQSIADLVCDIVYENVGLKPDVTLVEGNSNKDTVTRIEGHRLAVTPIHVPPITELNPTFIYIDQRLTDSGQLVALLEVLLLKLEEEPSAKFVVVFKSINDGVMSLQRPEEIMLLERVKLHFAVFNANIGGGMSNNILMDMCAITGGGVYRSIPEFRHAEPIQGNSDNRYAIARTYIEVTNKAKSNEPDINLRWDEIEEELNEMSGIKVHTAYAGLLRKRLAQLSPLHYIIHVGSETHSDFLERKDRFDDVITSATTNAIHGVIPGFNTSFLYAAMELQKPRERDDIDTALHEAFTDLLTRQSYRLKNGIDTDLTLVTDLSTGCTIRSEPEDITSGAIRLNIFDPAYTVISALRGGFRTGQILAKTKSVVVSNRFGSVTM